MKMFIYLVNTKEYIVVQAANTSCCQEFLDQKYPNSYTFVAQATNAFGVDIERIIDGTQL